MRCGVIGLGSAEDVLLVCSVAANRVDRAGRAGVLVGREPAGERDLATVRGPRRVALVAAAPRQSLEAGPGGAHRPDVRVLWRDESLVQDPASFTRPGEGHENGVCWLTRHATPPAAIYSDRLDLARLLRRVGEAATLRRPDGCAPRIGR